MSPTSTANFPVSDLVPNYHPKIEPTSTRLAVVGEAPGPDEVVAGEPFVGVSGKYLRAILAQCGASTNQIFYGNVCQHNPPGNKIERFDFDGPEIQDGIKKLKEDLSRFRPHCVLLLGRTALRSARPDLCYQTKKGYHVPLSDWRGSIFDNSEILRGTKTVATYHPAYILRSYHDSPFFKFDVGRAVNHSTTNVFTPRLAQGILRPTLHDVLQYIARVRAEREPTTFDIEGYPDVTGVTMLSLCPTGNPSTGIVIPFRLGGHYWTLDEEVEIWSALAGLFWDVSVPKCAHNCFYELFVLAWRHGILICNLDDDTMMAHWEKFPEFAKGDKEEKQKVSSTQKKRSLGICASIYTEQHFYKDDRLSNDPDVKLQYSFTDSSVTAEVRNVVTSQLQRVPASYLHYRFNISIIPAYNYIMLRGIRFDAEKANGLASVVRQEIAALNVEINHALEDRGAFGLFPVSKGKEKSRSVEGFNVKSNVQKAWLLYDHLKCKPLKKFTTAKTGKPSADEDALLHYALKTSDPLLRLVVRCVRKRTRLSDIGKLLPDPDGRLRCSYDPVGTNSGRGSCRNSMSLIYDDEEGEWVNTGTNMQNQTEELRVCEIADTPEHELGQWDLSGADAWTVAAELASIGYPQMLDDLLYGIKPSLVLYEMITAHSKGEDVSAINRLDRATLKSNGKTIKVYLDSVKGRVDPTTGRPLDWLYITCKRVQHGSNYDMQEERTSELIFGDSDGTVVIAPKDAKLYQCFYRMRYHTDKRNDWIRKKLSETKCIVTSCGIRRQFFGIRHGGAVDDAIVREASAVNPQANTTFITNSALRNLWYDPTNRRSNGSLFVEPLVQVHDALVVHHRTTHREFAATQMSRWFTVPMTIAGIQINIPVEGKYGPNWGECKTPYPF